MSGRQVRIGTVWDRTVDVLQGRAGMLAALATGFMVVPTLAGNALTILSTPGSAAQAVAGLVNIAASLLLLAGLLAVTAVASDPAVDRGTATSAAFRRLGPALGVLVVVILAAALVVLPIAWLAIASGAAYNPVSGKLDVSRASGSGIALAGFLSLAAAVAGLWLSAKLVPLFGVVVNERRGLGALSRSFALTRGAALRLIGVLILYGIVLVVVMSAATSVVGVVARLLLGAEATATVAFVVAIVSVLLTALGSVVQSVFYAQYYVAARDVEGVAPAA